MEFVGYVVVNLKEGRVMGIRNVSGRSDAKKILKLYFNKLRLGRPDLYRNVKILYVMTPGEVPQTFWNKIHDSHMRETDILSASAFYSTLVTPYLPKAEYYSKQTFSRLPKPLRDVMTGLYTRLYWTPQVTASSAINADHYRD